MKVEFLKVSQRKPSQIQILSDLFEEYFDILYSKILPIDTLKTLKGFVFADVLKDEIIFGEKEYYLILFDEVIVGFFEFVFEKEALYLNNIFIKKEFQNKNVGKKVLDFTVEVALKNGFKTIASYVPNELNDILNFFRKFDFQVIKQNVKYFGSGISIYCYKVEKEL